MRHEIKGWTVAACSTDIIREARSWCGTPFVHRGLVKGHGCDCIGLVLGVARAVHGDQICELPRYQENWSTTDREEALLNGFRNAFKEADRAGAQPGDAVVFRFRSLSPAQHCGIITDEDHFVEARHQAGVIETPISAPRMRTAVAFFRLSERVI